MIRELLIKISQLKNCTLYPPKGLPIVEYDLPDDVKEFYELCGGIDLFIDSDYSIKIVSPIEFEPANPVIIGENIEGDRSSEWYIIAKDENSQFITMDLNKNTHGRCYDSFHDRHGTVGNTDIIASSFTNFLTQLVNNESGYWYWLEDDFEYIGDAYEE
ncbi:SMI1 / KNR4 family (SUKH-1) [Paenibacillaceae bacterium GAS479]|nr:SMI1 / KNR4 family (SUKH-1) [Paenibacillaceae bacterium GAS479]